MARRRAWLLANGRRSNSGGDPLRAGLSLAALLFTLLVAGLGGLVLGTLGVMVGVYVAFARQVVPPETIANREIAQSTRIYDRNGELLYEIFDPRGERRTWVPLADIPESLKQATIATEDADFYRNPGFSLRGIVRATIQNLRGQDQIQGGSSITQQLVKNVLIPEEERRQRTVARKIKEVILAWEITRRYPKDRILEWYLNENYYGNHSYGIQAAAERYFAKSVKELSLAEASMLTGLPQAPNLYSPLSNPALAKQRQGQVLSLMVKQGYIDEEEAKATLETELHYGQQEFPIRAPHFVMYVRELLERRYGKDKVYRGGLRVTTSLDLRLQELGQEIVAEHVEKQKDRRVHNAALVALRPATGEILAMVGSADFFDPSIDGQVNMAVAERQPGSSFKPFTYVTAFMKGYTPATMLLDVPTSFPDGNNPPYVPENVDGKFRGPVSVREALAMSLNLPAVRTIQFAGFQNVIETAHRMGITTLNRKGFYGLSLTLGGGEVKPLDMAFAYAVFANGGMMAGNPVPPEDQRPGMRTLEPVAILRVEDSRGKALEEFKQPTRARVISPQLAYLITDILSDNQTRARFFGANNPLILKDRAAAAKTGTTNDYRDFWTLGYTPQLVTAVWVGNANNQPMEKNYSVTTAAPIWQVFMEAALEGEPPIPFPRPEGLVEATVCAVSGLLPNPYCPVKKELFIEGTVPKQVDNLYRVSRVDRTTGRLATPQTPPENVEERVTLVLPPEAADWVREGGVAPPPLPPPAVAVGNVVLLAPTPGATVGGAVSVRGAVSGGQPLSYRLEYGEGFSPAQWRLLESRSAGPAADVSLGSWNTVGLNGLYTLRLLVQTNGTSQSVLVPLTVDNQPPTVRVQYPWANTVITLNKKTESSIPVQAEVSDNVGVARVEFFVDEENLGYATVAPFHRSWQAREGKHTVRAVAYDHVGNRTESEPTTFEVRFR